VRRCSRRSQGLARSLLSEEAVWARRLTTVAVVQEAAVSVQALPICKYRIMIYRH